MESVAPGTRRRKGVLFEGLKRQSGSKVDTPKTSSLRPVAMGGLGGQQSLSRVLPFQVRPTTIADAEPLKSTICARPGT